MGSMGPSSLNRRHGHRRIGHHTPNRHSHCVRRFYVTIFGLRCKRFKRRSSALNRPGGAIPTGNLNLVDQNDVGQDGFRQGLATTTSHRVEMACGPVQAAPTARGLPQVAGGPPATHTACGTRRACVGGERVPEKGMCLLWNSSIGVIPDVCVLDCAYVRGVVCVVRQDTKAEVDAAVL